MDENTDQEMDYFNLDHDTLYEEYELPRSPTGSSSSHEPENCLDLSVLRQEQLVLAETAELINLPNKSPIIFSWTDHLSHSFESSSHMTSAEIINKGSTFIDTQKSPVSNGNNTNKEIIFFLDEKYDNSKQISGCKNTCVYQPRTNLRDNKNEDTVFQQKQEMSQHADISSFSKKNESKIMFLNQNSTCVDINKDCDIIKQNNVFSNNEKDTNIQIISECMVTDKLNINPMNYQNVVATSSTSHTLHQHQELNDEIDDINKETKDSTNACIQIKNSMPDKNKTKLSNIIIGQLMKEDISVHQEINSDNVIYHTLLENKSNTIQQLKEIDVSNVEYFPVETKKNLNICNIIEGKKANTTTNQLYQQDSNFIQVNNKNIALNNHRFITKNTEVLADQTITDGKIQTTTENICAISTIHNELLVATNAQHAAMEVMVLEEQVSSQVVREIEELQELGFEVMLPSIETKIKSQDCDENNSENNPSVSAKDKQKVCTVNTGLLTIDQIIQEAISNTDCKNHVGPSSITEKTYVSTTHDENETNTNTQHAAMNIKVNYLEEQINSQVDKEIEELQELGLEVMLPIEEKIIFQDCDKNLSKSCTTVNNSDLTEKHMYTMIESSKDKQSDQTENTETLIDQTINKDMNTDSKIQARMENICVISTTQGEFVATPNAQNAAMEVMVLEEQINSQLVREIEELQELGFEVMLPPIETNIKSQDCDKGHLENNLSAKDKKSTFNLNTGLLRVDQIIQEAVSNTGCKIQTSHIDYSTTDNIDIISTTHDKTVAATYKQHSITINCIEEQIDSQVDKEIEELQELGFEIMLPPIETNIKSQDCDKNHSPLLVESKPELNFLLKDCSLHDGTDLLTQSNIEKCDITNEQKKLQRNEISINYEITTNENMEEVKSIQEENDYLTLLDEGDCSFSEADKNLGQLSNTVGTESSPEKSLHFASPHSSKSHSDIAEESSLLDEIELTPKLDDMDYIDDIDYDDCDPYLTQSTIKSDNTEMSLSHVATSQIQSQDLNQTTENLLTFLNTSEDQDLRTFSEYLLPNQPFMGIGDIAVGTDASELEATLPNGSMLSQVFDSEANLPDCISAALPTNSDTNIENSKTAVHYGLTNDVFTQTESITTFNVCTQTEVVMEQLENVMKGTKRCAEDKEIGPAQKTTRVIHKDIRVQKKISPVGKLGKQIPKLEPPPPVRKSIRLGLSRYSKSKK